LTAQRGLGWGDSGEFQHWVLRCGTLLCGESFSNAHPLYVLFARLVARTPFAVTLVSSFFGALSVAGVFLCTRRLLPALLFGTAHMTWHLSCLAEVQTMSLAFTVYTAFTFLTWLETRRAPWFVLTAFLAGLHLECHNFALLGLPVYFCAACRRRLGARWALLSTGAFLIGAGGWLAALFLRGAQDVFVGRYGAAVAGRLPKDLPALLFNLTLAAVSFLTPALLLFFRPRRAPLTERRFWILLLFGVYFLFFIRYFVPDQATFLLPALFFAFLAVGDAQPSPRAAAHLLALQLILPVLLFAALGTLPVPEARRLRHPHRDDAAYFALPWKCHDDSADRCAAECGGEWNGYPRARP
jgi:hypothetical protein